MYRVVGSHGATAWQMKGRDLRDLLARDEDKVSDGMLIHAARLRWSIERMFVERQQQLRTCLRYAINQSPFFTERLWASSRKRSRSTICRRFRS